MKTNYNWPIFFLLFISITFGLNAQQTGTESSAKSYNSKGVLIETQLSDSENQETIHLLLKADYTFSQAKIGKNGSTFTGFKISEPNGPESGTLNYFLEDVLQPDDSAFFENQIKQFLNQYFYAFRSDSLLVGISKSFIVKYINKPDSTGIFTEEVKEDLVSLLRYMVFFSDYLDKENELKIAKQKLAEIRNSDVGQLSDYRKLEGQIKDIEKEKKLPARLELYASLNTGMTKLSKITAEKSSLEEEMGRRQKSYLEQVSKEFEFLTDSETKRMSELINQNGITSADSLISNLKKSLKLLDDNEILVNQLVDLKKSMIQTVESLKTYSKSEYQTIFTETVQPFIKKTEELQSKTLDQAKIELENLSQEGRNLLASLELIDQLGKSLTEDYKTLNDRYLQLYPPIYKKEVKPLAELIGSSSKVSGLTEKERNLKQLNDTLSYFKRKLDEFQSTDSLIDGRFVQFKEKLNLEDKVLYRMNIPGLEAIVKNYKMANLSAAKSVLSTELRVKISDLEGAYGGLSDQKARIDSFLPIVAQKYQQKYQAIYKTEITQLESRKDEYLKIPQADIRFNAGKTLLADIQHYEDHYYEIEDQVQILIAKIQEVEANYITLFQRIIKDEIGEIRKDYKIYEGIDFADKKLLKGKYMLEQLESMMNCIRELERNDGRLKTEMVSMMESYKNDYPLVYKVKIEPLQPVIGEYESSGYHQRKLTLSRTLIQNLDENLNVLERIKTQAAGIRKSYEEFDTYFQSKNQEKNLYRRTKSVYEDLYKEYEKEADPTLKTEKGDTILKVLVKINEMRGKDNKQFNEDIKDAKEYLKYIEILSRY
jgi:hypothetical protein